LNAQFAWRDARFFPGEVQAGQPERLPAQTDAHEQRVYQQRYQQRDVQSPRFALEEESSAQMTNPLRTRDVMNGDLTICTRK
jgi:predicted YcjX-like family ATPase